MAYLCKDGETRKQILSYIEEYVREYMRSPSIRDVAMGTGISRAMVQRYMAAMHDEGVIDYTRSDASTAFTRKIDRDRVLVGRSGSIACGVPREPGVDFGEYVSLPKSWLGDGVFYILEASGDSMIGAGIEDGDLVLVRQAETADDGSLAVVLVDGSETTLKRFYRDPKRKAYRLHAENPAYPDRIVKDAVVQGIAVKVLKNLK